MYQILSSYFVPYFVWEKVISEEDLALRKLGSKLETSPLNHGN